EHAFVATVHAYTNSQALVDHSSYGDPRDGRAAATNIVPAATGAASAPGQLFPHLRDRIDGIAYRVPTAPAAPLDLAPLAGRPADLARHMLLGAAETAADRAQPADGALVR